MHNSNGKQINHSRPVHRQFLYISFQFKYLTKATYLLSITFKNPYPGLGLSPVVCGALNFGNTKPNLVSIPAIIGKAKAYPPMWSG